MKITLPQAKKIGNILGLNFKIIPPEYFQYGMQIETEHGKINKKTNVTNDDLLMIGKIALIHIIEFPDYYIRLKKLEDQAEKYWSKRKKPNIFLTK